jgi:hypothetical protein
VALLFEAATDAAGHFVFETVPPGEWIVERYINSQGSLQRGHRPHLCSHGVPVAVDSGETAQLCLGGSGRTIIGNVEVSATNGPIAWTENWLTLTLKVAAPGAPTSPTRDAFSSGETFAAAMELFRAQNQAYWGSERGLAIQRLKREYRTILGPDGAFRIEDVPAGEYLLQVSIPDWPAPSRFQSGREIARLEMDVTIPGAASDADDSPANLGLLSLREVPGTSR